MGVIDILQTDINHVGGITGLWKVSQMAAVSGISMAPHACEGPDRRFGHAAREFRDAELRRAGGLRSNPARPDGQGLAGVVGIPRDANGGRAIPVGAKAGLGI